jgi:hypothetical protein
MGERILALSSVRASTQYLELVASEVLVGLGGVSLHLSYAPVLPISGEGGKFRRVAASPPRGSTFPKTVLVGRYCAF